MLGQYITTPPPNPGHLPLAPNQYPPSLGFTSECPSNSVGFRECTPVGMERWSSRFGLWEYFGGLISGPLQALSTQPSLVQPTFLKYPPYRAESQYVQGRLKVTAMILLAHLLHLRGEAQTEG